MENQVSSEVKREKNKGRFLIIIGIYLLSQFVLGSIIIMILYNTRFGFPQFKDVLDPARSTFSNNLLKYLSGTQDITNAEYEYKNAYSLIMGTSNLIIYCVSFFFILILSFSSFVEDFKALKERPKYYLQVD